MRKTDRKIKRLIVRIDRDSIRMMEHFHKSHTGNWWSQIYHHWKWRNIKHRNDINQNKLDILLDNQ